MGNRVGVSTVEHLVSAIQHSVMVDASQGRSEEHRKRIREFFMQNSDAFDLLDSEKGTTNIVNYEIETGDAR